MGKKDLRITLEAQSDVDIQLYDKAAAAVVTCGPDGKAIIGYFDGEDACKKGFLGNNDDGGEESATYSGLDFSYSGYSGVGGNLGNEYIQIEGVTNSVLNMKALG